MEIVSSEVPKSTSTEILLGKTTSKTSNIFNSTQINFSNTANYIFEEVEGSLLTIAPTGAGKGRSCIIPNLLNYEGPAIVIDPKGENYHVTADYRRKIGHQVIRIDPFDVIDEEGHGLNPLNLIRARTKFELDDARTLAHLIAPETHTKDPFWDNMARAFLETLLCYVVNEVPTVLRNLGEISYIASQNSKDLEITCKEISRSKNMDPTAKRANNFIAQAEPRVRASIISTLQSQIAFLSSSCLSSSYSLCDLDLDKFQSGEPITIYLIIPPDKLHSHGKMLRVWVGMLLSLLYRRTFKPELPTLFLLDEAAQLGKLDQLVQAITLMRGYGVITWSFWQDLSQIQNLYPYEWQAVVNNAHVFQAFGLTNSRARRQLLEFAAETLPAPHRFHNTEQQLLVTINDGPRLAPKLDYLSDPIFKGRCGTNPMYCSKEEAPKRAKLEQRPINRKPNSPNKKDFAKEWGLASTEEP
ncbi:type IV secretory system conjugative DNA transfer family protein [Sneathiella sp. P13V-1]|uniref:type IV secretory system conjugative DNA transfer family protein n=1 Tax=Sneathiella sp. P13V-1 TaxID=2697366 RepID=UPI00187B64C2|nr:type IV secretory system conjugative DNA transfer family protein [Sneathiella sp. P13V-1]MBE7637075.1 type IV secretory system conjugative DNA transfer family protein [Sneathiella sp. P13V-1]